MVKRIAHAAFDAALAWIAERAEGFVLLAGAPTTDEEAFRMPEEGGLLLARCPLRSGPDGDLALAPGRVSGRRLELRAPLAAEAMAEGVADHVALVSVSERRVLVLAPLGGPCEVTPGEAVTITGFGQEIADPA